MTFLKLAFFGTPAFAVPALHNLVGAGHRVVRVYTQPPRPAGRGHDEQASPVHRAAATKHIEVSHPATLKDADVQRDFAALGVDAGVVVAYGLMLPRAMLDAPRFGCLNIHASLLPRWRGAAPIQRAILAGDRETGVTIMRMDAGLDTGPTLLHERVPIRRAETGSTLHDVLAAHGAHLIVRALAGLVDGTVTPTPQPEEGVTYAAKIDKAETRLDWRLPADRLERAVRAFAPAPGAWFELPQAGHAAAERVRVLQAAIVEAAGAPGTALDDHLTIACGNHALRLVVLQRAGKTAMPADAFLRGRSVPKGTLLT
ncbi:MAG: methionyl-tRNA formyltransferase [Alphaproteobacteria bacterium]|nr:methionyl-tRNA formyltransferase [Alphaproteobacteria bacterium]